jgi:hypothetical protein
MVFCFLAVLDQEIKLGVTMTFCMKRFEKCMQRDSIARLTVCNQFSISTLAWGKFLVDVLPC